MGWSSRMSFIPDLIWMMVKRSFEHKKKRSGKAKFKIRWDSGFIKIMFITVVKQTIETTHMETAAICIERVVVLPRLFLGWRLQVCNLHSPTDSTNRGPYNILQTKTRHEFSKNSHKNTIYWHCLSSPRKMGNLMTTDTGPRKWGKQSSRETKQQT